MDGPQSYPVDRARRLAHRSGAIIGISAGVLLLPQFLQAAFTANSNDTWLTVLTGFAGLFAILPLGVGSASAR